MADEHTTAGRTAHAVVIGGGIGGLTAAAALHRDGWRVTVLERAGSLDPVGAAISLAPNALRALDVIGLGDEIRGLAAWQDGAGPARTGVAGDEGGVRVPSGRWLARSSTAAAAERFGGPLVLLHRATLIERLAARLPDGTVRLATAATLVDRGGPGRPARVGTADGELEADLVVAADGIRSGVRGALFPDHPGPVYSGFTTWRVVLPVPGLTSSTLASHETWGQGRIWGTHPLKDGRTYAYAAAVTPEGQQAPDDERAELVRRFGDWHDPIPAVLAAARPEDVLRHDVHHIAEPLPAHHRGRVALLGDAAHAMPPTLGQGGNQAIEDAIVLALSVPRLRPGAGAPVAESLAAYTAARQPRTTAITRRAVRVARLNMMSHPVGTAVRNAAIAVLSQAGPALFLRGFDGIADWRPPRRTYASEEAGVVVP
ncbi:FAD-dependent monooxygenase [Streptomyces poonensis]|uniref:Monooxygenase n=1 Tax=Streptomyces poonensis TaxID=68255 RepID=A0A918QD28_9ACTN|nr:FAD-dependent monooxygenase [Streptomyces poonensis]GGZ42226.1 monooxygenase [Streptomyces poonensis]GLJ92735.1 monooxygenase [Streptomyces poonensis]